MMTEEEEAMVLSSGALAVEIGELLHKEKIFDRAPHLLLPALASILSASIISTISNRSARLLALTVLVKVLYKNVAEEDDD